MGLGESWGSESQGTMAAAVLPGRVAAKICSLSSPWGRGGVGGRAANLQSHKIPSILKLQIDFVFFTM